MILKKWEDLPDNLRTDAVRPYYDLLAKRRGSLALKRCFDVVVSAVMLLILAPVFLVLAIAIKLDSPGPVFYRQVRVTQYGKEFRIFKFRTMVVDADKTGGCTAKDDPRVTKSGRIMRRLKLDELPQLINVLIGDMSLVGPRPELRYYIDMYTEREMKRRIFRLWPKIHFHKGFDVLVTHCPARHLNDFDTITHRGFDCFNKLLEKYRPKLFMHGHIHRNYGARIPQKSEHDGTLVINASDYCIFDIGKSENVINVYSENFAEF